MLVFKKGVAICTSKVARCTSKYFKTNRPICEMTKMETNTTLRALGLTLYAFQQKNHFPPFFTLFFFLSTRSCSTLLILLHYTLGTSFQASRVKDKFVSDCYSLWYTSYSLFISIHTLFKRFSFVTLNQWTSKSSFQITITMSRYAMTSFFGLYLSLEDLLGVCQVNVRP